jgi:hypothetical protein
MVGEIVKVLLVVCFASFSLYQWQMGILAFKLGVIYSSHLLVRRIEHI